MLVLPQPAPGRDYGQGWIAFTNRDDSLISGGIGWVTAPELQRAGHLVATHCGLVVDLDHIAEAHMPSFSVSPLAPLIGPDKDVAIWFRKPLGLTAVAAEHMAAVAQGWARDQVGYDQLGVAGFVLPGDPEDPEKLFCSEAVVTLLLEAEKFMSRPLPGALHEIPAHHWSPHALDTLDGLWAA